MSYKNYPDIETPRGSVIVNGKGKAELTWNPDFEDKWNGRFTEAQFFLDSEVYRNSEKFTPKKTGMLVMSGELGTVFGRGYVEWIAPYAVYQYYMPNRIGSPTGELRGPFWFERAKEIYKDRWIEGVEEIAKGEG